MTRHTLRVDADPEGLAEVIAEIKRRGYHVECPAFDGRERLKERDELLRAAHGLMDGTSWARCVALEREIRRFETIQWPRLREHDGATIVRDENGPAQPTLAAVGIDAPPEPCSALRRYLFEARRLGPLPTTARQIRNIIAKSNAPCDFAEAPL